MTKLVEPLSLPDHGPERPGVADGDRRNTPTAPSDLATRPEFHHLNPWERSVRESDRDWAFFVQYRDSAYPNGPFGEGHQRRIKVTDLAALWGLQPNSLYKVSTNFSWEWRCVHFDRWVDAQRLEANKGLLERTAAAHERLLDTTQRVVELELGKLAARANDPQTPALRPGELRALMELLIEQQRLLAGQATARVEHTAGLAVDLTKLTLEELQALHTARERAGIELRAINTSGESVP